ncbi:WEB family protein At5g55860-like isoform X1 [Zingiber officinale]|uniref:WEB family protein At5g55860-like isoform X1 n=1 Tax=Zingiber officinale TaxID=94328 RepID=UPI001C4C9911|nr:WEB family protein At5g55860-like isoform X1 [Zingiber officinale]
MGTKLQQTVTDSSKAEIDTRAPFESVKAAVSLFGEVAFTSDRVTVRKPKPPPIEQRALAKETQLHLAKKELNKYKEQLNNAETTRIQALAELESAKLTVEELTKKLNEINESKESALKATEAAKGQTKKLEDVSSVENIGNSSGWEQEFDNAREQYAVAITELDAAKQELRRIKKEFDASMEAKLNAIQQEAEAKELFDANTNKVAELSKEISAAQESLMHVKLATDQARQDELKIHSEKDATRLSYKQALEEAEKKLASLKKEFDPEVNKNLESKLAETNAEIEVVQKKLEDARAKNLEFVTTETSELDGAKEMLQKLVEEENSLRTLVESLKLELEAVQKEHAELKEKDAVTESVVSNLHLKLQKCKAELEAAVIAESKATSASDDLVSALQQLSSESQTALQEAEEMKKSAEELNGEAKAAQSALVEAEEKLQFALKDAEEAKAAETRALDLIKELSAKTNVARASTSESGANITISKEEYESLTRKVDESEKLTEMKVGAALAQVEAVHASENEAIKKLEAARKEMEDMEAATEEALKKAEMAEAAKKAVEGELKKWREKELKRAAETASRILAETQMSAEPLPPKPVAHSSKTSEKTDENCKVLKPSSSKKSLFQNFSGIFHRKKSQVDGGSPSYLPGEKPV